ncbi:PEP-CTERM sorting domain-containing protein [Geomonas sp. RF6]|uniref:PEP-CTERM sorting domain-containing protein n=1 Tax=Geomonas sp. RF6 TaxID=2897342 RepID=UPI001E46D684|nr:PEP-CTERM sorting domain-containing protein [Geomonas sp. RF6]UFS69556.1 PEP-CTERM sorting domain-containing protein [Geomonas sp. RF6]
MRKVITSIFCGLLLLAASGAQASIVTNSYTFLNVILDGKAVSDPVAVDFSGRGTFSGGVYNTPGTYTVLSFIDNEIDAEGTGFDPEFGGVKGNPLFTYQIASPAALWDNFTRGTLNGTINTAPADVAVAMGFNFTLKQGERATVSYLVRDAVPGEGDVLTHTDAVYSGDELDPYGKYDLLSDTLYYSGNITIEPWSDTNPVPEPSTFALVGLSMTGLALFRRRRCKS